jgi:hypothetical protein
MLVMVAVACAIVYSYARWVWAVRAESASLRVYLQMGAVAEVDQITPTWLARIVIGDPACHVTSLSVGGFEYSRASGTKRLIRSLEQSAAQPTDTDLCHLRALMRLERLCLSGAELTDDGLANLHDLPRLASVKLRGALITDAAVDHLLQIPRLETLDLVDTQMSAHGLARLAREAPHIRVSVRSTTPGRKSDGEASEQRQELLELLNDLD